MIIIQLSELVSISLPIPLAMLIITLIASAYALLASKPMLIWPLVVSIVCCAGTIISTFYFPIGVGFGTLFILFCAILAYAEIEAVEEILNQNSQQIESEESPQE